MIKQFLRLMRRYVTPYKTYLTWSVIVNFISQWLNVFSFALLIPILNILFQIDTQVYTYREWSWSSLDKETIQNNGYAYVQEMIAQHGAMTTLIIMGAFMILFTAFKTAGYFGASALMVPLRTGIVRDIRMQVYNKILSLHLGFFSDERKGDIIARMSADVTAVETCITASIDSLIKHPITIMVYFFVMFYVSWELTVFVLVVAPIMIWSIGTVTHSLKRRSKEAQTLWGDLLSSLEETLGGLRVIKAFVAEHKMQERFGRLNEQYRTTVNGMAIRQNAAHPVSEFMGTAMIIIVLWFGGWVILSGSNAIDASIFIFYMVILYSVIAPIKEFAKVWAQIPVGLASMDRIDFILKTDNPIADGKDEIKDMKEGVEFRDVTFSYNGERDVLHHVNLTIQKGKTIALVGQSGSGKSTLVDLIPRFHDVTTGQILIDGKDVRALRLSELRSLIGNVNQESILFNDTFYNNITFGVESATMDQVIEAARIANAHDFIMESEDGYNTMIGDRGGRLSGGQRQRVSIARAILKNPPILILDEATSALDTESERLVQEALERLMKSRTTIAIAHRLSTIKNADEICVLHEGQIVERGTHESLLALGGYYKHLNDMQTL